MRRHKNTLSPVQAIRKNCLWCMGGHDGFVDVHGDWVPPCRPYGSVRNCRDSKCWLWPYRLGTHPARQKKEPEQLSRAA
jgi:hypothetical protein